MELSVWIEDRGCGRFIYLRVCWSGTIALEVLNSSVNSASEAEDMTTLIIWARERTGPLSRGIVSLSKQNYLDYSLQSRQWYRYDRH